MRQFIVETALWLKENPSKQKELDTFVAHVWMGFAFILWAFSSVTFGNSFLVYMIGAGFCNLITAGLSTYGRFLYEYKRNLRHTINKLLR